MSIEMEEEIKRWTARRISVSVRVEFKTNPIGFEDGENGDEAISAPLELGLRDSNRSFVCSSRRCKDSAFVDKALLL